MTVTYDVNVFGPNLMPEEQDKGELHVHAASCQHPEPHGASAPWQMRVQAKEEVATNVYPPEDFEWDYADKVQLENYVSDFYWAPCTRSIPRFLPAVDETDVTDLPPLQGGEFALTNGKHVIVKPSKMQGQWIISVHEDGRPARRVARGQLPSILAGLPAVINKESE